MTDIVACYNVWNEEVLIAESVRSVKAYVDRFLFFDSVWEHNPVDATHSTDRTRKRAEAAAAPVPVTYVESDRKMELSESRNIALDMIPDEDWAFLLDGDETMVGEHEDILTMFAAIRAGELVKPIGVWIYTAALLVDKNDPYHGIHDLRVSKQQYGRLPVYHTRGIQPRLLPSAETEWHRAPGQFTYGLYSHGIQPYPAANDVFSIINHRTRQSWAAYQHDFVWETAINESGVG